MLRTGAGNFIVCTQLAARMRERVHCRRYKLTRVLIIDDDSVLQKELKNFLKKA